MPRDIASIIHVNNMNVINCQIRGELTAKGKETRARMKAMLKLRNPLIK